MSAYSVACKIKGNDRFYETNKFGGVLLNRDIRPIIEEEFNVDYENLAQTNEIKSIEENVKLALYCITLVKNKDFFVKNEIIYRENSTTGELYVVRNETGLFIALANKMPADAYVSKLCKKPSVWNSNYFYGIFSKLGRLCGTSATVCSFKKEFKDIYGIEVVAIPTVLPIRRIDQTVGLYVSRNDKNFDIVDMISEKYRTGQPVLLIVEDIKESDEFSEMLSSYGIEHVVINGLNAENSPEIFASAGTFGSVVIATQLANRGIDIKLGGDAQRMTIFDLVENGIDVSDIDQIMYKLPTSEIRSSELYRNYSAFYERNKAIVAENKIKVLEAGGLCVISTTAYSDMRVEQQIRGRAGRQGDVGESYVFLSMEDKVFSGIFSMWKTNEFWANLIQGTKTVEHPMLKRRIESFKFNVHHRTFREMKNATVLCERIERSKNEIFKLKYGIADGSVTFDDLIRIWSQDEDNVNSVREIVKGTAQKAILSVSRLCEGSIDLFTGIDEKKIKERLFEIARLYVSECATDDNEKKKAFVAEASKLLSMHLTDMRDAEEMYGATDIKNSNKFFEDMYAKNLSKQITAAIDRWLMNL